MHHLKKNSTIFLCHLAWHILERVQSAQNKYGGRLERMLLHDPREVSWVITAIPFKSVLWHPAHKEFSLIHMNLMNIDTSK